MWADWIASVLKRAGFRVLPHGTVVAAGSIAQDEAQRGAASASRTIAVLSTAYVRSPQARGVWEAMAAADPAGTRRQLIPVRVGEVRPTPPFSDRMPVDLTRLEPDQAVEALLRELGRPSRLPEHPADPGFLSRDGRGRSRRCGTSLPATPRSLDGTPCLRNCAISWPTAAKPWSCRRPCTGLAVSGRRRSRSNTRTGTWRTTTWCGGCRPSSLNSSIRPSPRWRNASGSASATASPRQRRQRVRRLRQWRALCALASHLRQRG